MAFGLNTIEKWKDYQKYTNHIYETDDLKENTANETHYTFLMDLFLYDLPVKSSISESNLPFDKEGKIDLPFERFFLVQDVYNLPYVEFYKYIKNSNEFDIKKLLDNQEEEFIKLKVSSRPFFNKNISMELDRENKNKVYFKTQRNTFDIKNEDVVFTEVFEEEYLNDQTNTECLDIFTDLYKDIRNIKFQDLEVIQNDEQKHIMIDKIVEEFYEKENPTIAFFIKNFFKISGISYSSIELDFYLPILWKMYIISKYQKNMEKDEIRQIIDSFFKQKLQSELNLTFQNISDKEEPFNIGKFMELRKEKLDQFEKQFDPFFFKIKYKVNNYNSEQYLKYFSSKDYYKKWNKFFLQDLFLRGKISLDSLQNYIQGVSKKLKKYFQNIEFFTEDEKNTKYYKMLLQTLYEDKLPILEFLTSSEDSKTNYPICINQEDIMYYDVYDFEEFKNDFKHDTFLDQNKYRFIESEDKIKKEIEQTLLLNVPITEQYNGKIVIPLKIPAYINFESPIRIKKDKYVEIVTVNGQTFLKILENNTVKDVKTKRIIGDFNEELNLLVININDCTFEYKEMVKIFFDIDFDVDVEYDDNDIKVTHSDNLFEDQEFIYFDLPLNKQFIINKKSGVNENITSKQFYNMSTVFLQTQQTSGTNSFTFEYDDINYTIKKGSVKIKVDGTIIQIDDETGNITGDYLGGEVSGQVNYTDGVINIISVEGIDSGLNVTLDYQVEWESVNYFKAERDDRIDILIGDYEIYQDQTDNLFYDKPEYNQELDKTIYTPINVGKYLEKERMILIKKYFDDKLSHEVGEDEQLPIPDVSLSDDINIKLNTIYQKDYIYYIFCKLFQEYNHWYNTENYKDKTSQFIYNKYSVLNLKEMDYFQLQKIHKEILYRMIFDLYFVDENHYSKQSCIYNQFYPSSLNKKSNNLFEMNSFVNIIPNFDIFYFDFKKLFNMIDIDTPEETTHFNQEENENEPVITEEKRRILLSLSKDNLLIKINDSLNTDNLLNPFFDQNRYILSSTNRFDTKRLQNFVSYDYSENKIEEVEKNSNFLSYFPQYQIDFKYDYQLQDLNTMNIDVNNLQMDVLDTIKLIRVGSLKGLIKQGTSYFNFTW